MAADDSRRLGPSALAHALAVVARRRILRRVQVRRVVLTAVERLDAPPERLQRGPDRAVYLALAAGLEQRERRSRVALAQRVDELLCALTAERHRLAVL